VISLAVSVSDLDSFRRYRDHEEMSLAELMKKLNREEPPTEKMLAGRALHTVLETARDGVLSTATVDGHVFLFELDAEIALRPIREMRGQREYQVTMPNGTHALVTVRGRVDSIDGTAIEDHKLSGDFDADRYHDAYQWRLYLSIFGCEKFTYNVFTGRAKEIVVVEPEHNDGEGGSIDVGPSHHWTVTDFHRITFYRYPEIEADILRELSLFAEFALNHLVEHAARGTAHATGDSSASSATGYSSAAMARRSETREAGESLYSVHPAIARTTTNGVDDPQEELFA